MFRATVPGRFHASSTRYMLSVIITSKQLSTLLDRQSPTAIPTQVGSLLSAPLNANTRRKLRGRTLLAAGATVHERAVPVCGPIWGGDCCLHENGGAPALTIVRFPKPQK